LIATITAEQLKMNLIDVKLLKAALRDSVQGFEWIPDQIPRFRDLWKRQ